MADKFVGLFFKVTDYFAQPTFTNISIVIERHEGESNDHIVP